MFVFYESKLRGSGLCVWCGVACDVPRKQETTCFERRRISFWGDVVGDVNDALKI